MNVTFSCPMCEQPSRADVTLSDRALDCGHCHGQIQIPEDAFDGEKLTRCLVCPSRDLFLRKDFPQRVGVAIVVVGFLASCIAWYYYWVVGTFAILFATAGIDVLLYLLVGDALVCYRCNAHYRFLPEQTGHGPFSLETHERYRQQAARLAGK